MDYIKAAKEAAELLDLNAIERDKNNDVPTASISILKEKKLLSLFGKNQINYNQWNIGLKVVQILAEVDTSIAHLLGYHYLITSQLLYRGDSEQTKHFKSLIDNQFFFGNSSNPLSKTLYGKSDEGEFIINGFKNFSTGSNVANYLRISWTESQEDMVSYDAIVPINRTGITVNNDWDCFGQKQTGSGTVIFKNVHVYSHEIIKADKKHITSLFSQAILLNIFAGASIGALKKAKEYIESDKKKQDDIMFLNVGKLYSKIENLKIILKYINNLMNHLWRKRYSITNAERGEFALSISSASTFSTEVAIEVANKIFEIMGARSTTNKLGYDRIWRNIRVLTLHSSMDLRHIQLGKSYLNNQYPKQGFYS